MEEHELNNLNEDSLDELDVTPAPAPVVEPKVNPVDVLVLGSDLDLVAAVETELDNKGLSHKTLDSHLDLEDAAKAGCTHLIVNCGDGWDAFVEACRVSYDHDHSNPIRPVLQFASEKYSVHDHGHPANNIVELYNNAAQSDDSSDEEGGVSDWLGIMPKRVDHSALAARGLGHFFK